MPPEEYNASVVDVRSVHEGLRIFRVRADGEQPQYRAGQYTTLGLGDWEPRCDGIEAGQFSPSAASGHLIRRAYSIACPLLESGRLMTCGSYDFLEFYVALVKTASDTPPTLTPRLFALDVGSRLFMGLRPRGQYTLAAVGPRDDVVFIATGTGEAPHNAMTAELLGRRHEGRIASLTSVRYERDLAYLAAQRELERMFPNYRYVALTTREPRNVDPSHPQYVGRRHVQEFVASGDFEEQAEVRLDPARTHVYLCGSPAMIGAPRRDGDGHLGFPEPAGMAELLVHRGFRLDEPRRPGNVHFERYW